MKRNILLIIIVAMSIIGCKKDEIHTEAEKTAEHLKEVISENKLKRIVAYKTGLFEPTTLPSKYGVEFSFKDGYISIFDGFNTDSYNLANLKTYQIRYLTITADFSSNTKSEKTLILTF